jgi:hypothetical protein
MAVETLKRTEGERVFVFGGRKCRRVKALIEGKVKGRWRYL